MSRRSLTDPAGRTIKFTDVGNGMLLSQGFPEITPEMTKTYFNNIQNFECRKDDVVLLNWPKTGSNWLIEIMAMLVNRSAEYQKIAKMLNMFEFVPQDKMDTIPSPRVLNTHVPYRYLPREMASKQIKAVLVVRNPKDTLVSLYNHLTGFKEYEYDGQWKDFLQLYVEGGEMMYGLYSDYLKAFERAIEADSVGFPLHLVHYEDLKQGGVDEIRKLARFLEVDLDDEVYAQIHQKCDFSAMVQVMGIKGPMHKMLMNDHFHVYRKGQIGDWKNWFTVAQSEQFDAYWERQMADSKMKFTYSPNTDPR